MRVAVIAAAAGALLLAGCGGSSGGTSAGHSPSPDASAQLAALAQRGTTADYTATYRLQPSTGTTPGTVTVYRLGTSLRLDVTSGATTAVLVENSHGRFSCRLAGASKVCFKVAAAGAPLPPEFDPGLQLVFTGYLTDLAAHASGYGVRRSGGTPSGEGVPAGTCFVVTAGSTTTPSPAPSASGTAGPAASASPGAAAQRVTSGTYCLTGAGVVTKVRYEGGSLDLTRLGPAPAVAKLQPPVSPTPLPSAPTG